ncbi:1-phosphofructokinase [Romboutsia lituseburensis]|uniref:Tagatose-6-phosphate kinase n=1 Tax=Romboutsia lituseburensis DSM 797 TaxID=1121325 RepID=A0A1G9JFZ4_9FIRM|nr:1-phosphofructokinase [Romboutsia lituseburensis]CEH33514.1 1-phosphofructokinase [Romboutsia lituseburensis]SDL36165.1 fructose-1-phosphate kinase [Romboutsia lituseburensis DSM 797]
MIYTVTLNPSIDYVVKLNNLSTGDINRSSEEYVYPGGKGINVSLILKELGYKSNALGFISGFTGQYIESILNERGLNSDFIKLENGFTRINVKIKSNEETEINGQGPHISSEKLDKLYEKIESLNEDDILVLAGSIPSTLDEKLYENIMARIENKGIKVVVDATKNLLLNVLKYKPFLIKPNNIELEEMFNVKLETTEDIVLYANKLKEMGAKNVLVSMGKDGGLLVTEDNKVLKSSVAKGEVKNSVGAGDSMVGGFIAGYLKNKSYEEALKLGAASGSATAFSYDLATSDFINELLEQINIEYIN